MKPGIWEHIYRAGIQAGGKPMGIGWHQAHARAGVGLNAKNLVPYTVAALKKFYDVFPEFTETQFRMHEESGLLKSEIEPFWHDVFAFFRNSKPERPIGISGQGPAKIRHQGRSVAGSEHPTGHEDLDGADGPAISSDSHQPSEPDGRPPKLRGPAGISADLSHELDTVERRHNAACCSGPIRITRADLPPVPGFTMAKV